MIRVCRLSVCYTLTAIFATVLYSTLFATVARGAQVILTFDDIATASMPVPMPAGYGGVNWAGNIGVWADDQPPYNPKSPPNRVLFNLHSESGVAESIVAFIGGPKSFAGAYFSGSGNAQFNLYTGTTLVGSSSVLNLSGVPTFLASGYAAPVEKVGIIGNRGSFAMDNFTFDDAPEPSSFCLVTLGILAFAARRQTRIVRTN